jgi:hypothetical protein
VLPLPGRGLSLDAANTWFPPGLARADDDGPRTRITRPMETGRTYEHRGFAVVKVMPVPGSDERFRSVRREEEGVPSKIPLPSSGPPPPSGQPPQLSFGPRSASCVRR